MKTKQQNKFENRNEINNKTYNNGKQIELGQIIKFKTNGKIWGRMQKESENRWKTTTYTHVRIFRFPMFDTHPRLSFIRFQFYHFSILWFAIPNFDVHIVDTFKIHVSIIHLSTCRFYFSAFWCLISGLRRFDTSQIVFHFESSRFSDFTFIVSDIRFPIFEFPMSTAKRKKRCPPQKTNGTSSNEPKTFGTYFKRYKRYCTRHVAHVPWVPNLFSL